MPDIDAPDLYSRHGVEFSYPANWQVEEKVQRLDDDGGELRSISVGYEGQGGTYLRVLSPPPEDGDLERFANDFKESLKQRYWPIYSLHDESEMAIEAEVAGEVRKGIRKRLDFSYFFIEIPLELDFFLVESKEMAVYLVSISMEKKRRSAPGFSLIQRTLRLIGPPPSALRPLDGTPAGGAGNSASPEATNALPSPAGN